LWPRYHQEIATGRSGPQAHWYPRNMAVRPRIAHDRDDRGRTEESRPSADAVPYDGVNPPDPLVVPTGTSSLTEQEIPRLRSGDQTHYPERTRGDSAALATDWAVAGRRSQFPGTAWAVPFGQVTPGAARWGSGLRDTLAGFRPRSGVTTLLVSSQNAGNRTGTPGLTLRPMFAPDFAQSVFAGAGSLITATVRLRVSPAVSVTSGGWNGPSALSFRAGVAARLIVVG
jgi:hypothetical protein